MSPSIDKGQAGSKTVRTKRTAIWQIKCKGGKHRNTVINDPFGKFVFVGHLGLFSVNNFSQNTLMNVCLFAISSNFELKFDDLMNYNFSLGFFLQMNPTY